MKPTRLLAALVALCLAPMVWAQAPSGGANSTSRTSADPPNLVAVLNVQLAIANTAEGKQAAAELQSQFTPRRNELDTLNKRIQDLQNRLANGERTLSDEEKQRLELEGQSLTKQLQRKQQELQDDANDARTEVLNRIGRKMMEALDKYAKEHAYSVVLDTSAQNSSVLYAANTVDITQEIIRLYDQSYPVKGAATTKPAANPATKPAANPPAKPPANPVAKPPNR